MNRLKKDKHTICTMLQIEQYVNNIERVYINKQILIEQKNLANDISLKWSRTLNVDLDVIDIINKILYTTPSKTKNYFDIILKQFIYYIKSEQNVVGVGNVFREYLTEINNKLYENASSGSSSSLGNTDSDSDSDSVSALIDKFHSVSRIVT